MKREQAHHLYEGDQVPIWPTGADRCRRCGLPEINRVHQEQQETAVPAELPPTPDHVREAEARRFGE